MNIKVSAVESCVFVLLYQLRNNGVIVVVDRAYPVNHYIIIF